MHLFPSLHAALVGLTLWYSALTWRPNPSTFQTEEQTSPACYFNTQSAKSAGTTAKRIYVVQRGDSYIKIARKFGLANYTDDRAAAITATHLAQENRHLSHALNDHLRFEGGTWHGTSYDGGTVALGADGIPDGRLQPSDTLYVPVKNPDSEVCDSTVATSPTTTKHSQVPPSQPKGLDALLYTIIPAALISYAAARYAKNSRTNQQKNTSHTEQKTSTTQFPGIIRIETVYDGLDYEFITESEYPKRETLQARVESIPEADYSSYSSLELAVSVYQTSVSGFEQAPRYEKTVPLICSEYNISQRELYRTLDAHNISRRKEVYDCWRKLAIARVDYAKQHGESLSKLAHNLGISKSTVYRYSRYISSSIEICNRAHDTAMVCCTI